MAVRIILCENIPNSCCFAKHYKHYKLPFTFNEFSCLRQLDTEIPLPLKLIPWELIFSCCWSVGPYVGMSEIFGEKVAFGVSNGNCKLYKTQLVTKLKKNPILTKLKTKIAKNYKKKTFNCDKSQVSIWNKTQIATI